MGYTILLVDDDVSLLIGLKKSLSAHYRVEVAHRGAQALQKISESQYHCIILDLSLPDMLGIEVCRKIRQASNATPIIVLSGDASYARKAELLDAGADDYLTKPIHITELEARLRTAIRHSRLPQSLGAQLHLHGVALDSLRHTVERDGVMIQLRPKEFSLLECLMNNAGHVVSRPVLLQYAWDESTDVWHNVVDVHIKYLRDKLDYPFKTPLIKTVHGLGYKFDASTVANIKKGGREGERTIASRSH